MGERISDPFLVVYGDSLLRLDYTELLGFHRSTQSHCTIVYHRPVFSDFLYEYHDNALSYCGKRTNYGVLDVNSNERVVHCVEKPPLDEIKKRFENAVASAAVYLLRKSTLDHIPPDTASDFPSDLFPKLISRSVPCYGFDIGKGYRIDIGTLPSYYKTQMSILHGEIPFDLQHYLSESGGIWFAGKPVPLHSSQFTPPLLLCSNCSIGDGTVIDRSIIGNDVAVGSSCKIRNSILLDHVVVGDGVEISTSVVGENCRIYAGSILPKNTVLGSYCTIGDPNSFQ